MTLLICAIAPLAEAQQGAWPIDILRRTFDIRSDEQIDVPMADIHQGCARRNCIPSIDAPRFVTPDKARLLEDDDLVLGLVRGEVKRAYPAFILNRHEVVNDEVDGEPIAITYCPLCGSGVAFLRTLDQQVVEFGVSGLLHNSDLVLYDRATNSLWQQITGQAISGPMRGRTLQPVALSMTTWREWLAAYPDSLVLAGEPRTRYGNKRPYGDYEQSERLMFPANAAAGRMLHPKRVVHGVRFEDRAAAVSERALEAQPRITVDLDGVTLVWHRRADGHVTVERSDTGEELLSQRMFWFAWYSFNTDTALWDSGGVD
jgi:hypothetical protein